MEKYAPIIIPTLCRFEKFKVLIESLAKNKEYASQTELVIGLDYPPSNKYEEGYLAIKAYLPTIKGFGKVTIIEHSENKGAIGNEDYLINYVYSKGYDRYIFTEDDNEFSPNFLEYINKGLDKYNSNPRVYSISGYNYPINMDSYEKNIFASYHCSAWGCGYWKKKRVVHTLSSITGFVFTPSHFFKLLLKAPRHFISLLFMYKKHEVHGDACHEIYCCINNWVSIFPTISKVRNWGHDGSGEHGKINPEEDLCYNQEIDTATTFEFDDIPLKDFEWKPLRDYFHKPLGWYVKKIYGKIVHK